MTPLQFMNDTHKDFFFHAMTSRNISFKDHERVALFYTLGLMQDTRQRIHEFYDDKRDCICPDVLHASFQTSGTLALTRFAFTLYNNYQEQERYSIEDVILYEKENIYSGYFTGSPYFYMDEPVSFLNIFCAVERDYVPYLFEAIKLRLNMVTL